MRTHLKAAGQPLAHQKTGFLPLQPRPAERAYRREVLEAFRACALDLPYREPTPRDLETFFIVCSHHGLTAGLALQLVRHGHPDPVFLEEARERYKRLFFQHAQYQVLLASIHRGLERTGAEVLLLKGAALNRHLYAPGLRHVSDVDLFAVEENRVALKAVLAELGFREATEFPILVRDDGLCVDLHGPSFGRAEEALGLTAERLWVRSVPDREWGCFRLLAPEDELVYLAAHALKHSFERLVWLWDIWLAGRRLGPVAESRPALARALRYARFAAADTLHPPALEPGLSWLERRFLRAMVRGRRQPLGQLLLAVCQPGWGERLRFLRLALHDRQDVSLTYLAQRLGGQLAAGLAQAWSSLVGSEPRREA